MKIGLSDPRSKGPFSTIGLSDPRSIGIPPGPESSRFLYGISLYRSIILTQFDTRRNAKQTKTSSQSIFRACVPIAPRLDPPLIVRSTRSLVCQRAH